MTNSFSCTVAMSQYWCLLIQDLITSHGLLCNISCFLINEILKALSIPLLYLRYKYYMNKKWYISVWHYEQSKRRNTCVEFPRKTKSDVHSNKTSLREKHRFSFQWIKWIRWPALQKLRSDLVFFWLDLTLLPFA